MTTFYNAQFTESMTGMSPITDKIDTIHDINLLVLLNDSPSEIQFVGDSSMTFNTTGTTGTDTAKVINTR